MIDISGNDIAELGDADLRSLIGLLCEAELRSIGLPTAGVTWGGHQDAKDGGIDVRVEISADIAKDGFIPKSHTGFQVKKPDMPRASIISEMRPEGQLRQVIKDLVENGGAYIIVSSQGSTADFALQSRRAAMKEALHDCTDISKAVVDFYDRERIAAWVRNHPSLILWVRDKLGRPLQGWKAYDNWARSPGGIEEEYILDGNIRLYNSTNLHSSGLSAIDGINELRSRLHRYATSIRLVGLSGVGKTRLIQALFDERIGEKPLNPSQVFYCDINDFPNPDPRHFAEYLIAMQKPEVLVVDNCPPDLHKNLTSVCSSPGSQLSLITVEYDVRDDQPEETEVFRLEPASTEIVQRIIRARFKYISQVDASTIADFSGGNARIAIALANTIRNGENLANLRDEELFTRLFQQRNSVSNLLFKVAEVCSLVYSFDGESVDTNSELQLIGSLVGVNASEVYENVSELMRRELVQKRGRWRAILPHAVANRLAKRALEDIPCNNIYSLFVLQSTERLLKSFSRRLSYLHECDAAVKISKIWLSENGLLGDVSNLNNLGISLLMNIAPVNPELTLSAIERVKNLEKADDFFTRNNGNFREFTRLLRSLAYDKDLFERSVDLLCNFALSESPKENNDSVRKLLESLFYIYYSGTHATPSQRLNVISKLLDSNNDEKIDLGISLLSASLESWRFDSTYNFEFGARSRDYGLSPHNREEVCQWFRVFIGYAVSKITSNSPTESKIKVVFAEQFRGLWTKAGLYDELESAAREICGNSTWKEGWVAVKITMRFDGENMKPEILSRLNDLSTMLIPTSLIDRARLYAFSSYMSALDIVDINESSDKDSDEYALADRITHKLGCEIGSCDDLFKELLPDLVSRDGVRLFCFGQGLAEGTNDPEAMWQDFCRQISLTSESKRTYQVLRGFLNEISQKDPTLCEKLLDDSIKNEFLAKVYPYLQTSIDINEKGVVRLKKSLESDIAPIQQYNYLAYGMAHKAIYDEDLCDLLRIIASKDNGIEVSIEILHMRLHGYEKEHTTSSSIITLGRELLLNYQFPRSSNSTSDYKIATIIKNCFIGESAENTTVTLCKNILRAHNEYRIYSLEYRYILDALAQLQPKAFLDVFLGDEGDNDFMKHVLWNSIDLKYSIPLSQIDDDFLIIWCDQKPEVRYPKAASLIVPFKKDSSVDSNVWTPLALKIIENSPDPILVLNNFVGTFMPHTWSGSLADTMESYVCLIICLKGHENPIVVDWANKEEKKFLEEIKIERESELRIESERFSSFE